MNEYKAKKLLAGVSLVLLILSIFFVLSVWSSKGLLMKLVKKQEVMECLRLKSYSEQFEQFWLTEWQKQMCDSHNIEIVAPVATYHDQIK